MRAKRQQEVFSREINSKMYFKLCDAWQDINDSISEHANNAVKSNLINVSANPLNAVFKSDKLFARWLKVNQGFCVLF